jgi:hypothetical protein
MNKLTASETLALDHLRKGTVRLRRFGHKWHGMPCNVRSIKVFENLHRKEMAGMRHIVGGIEFYLIANTSL